MIDFCTSKFLIGEMNSFLSLNRPGMVSQPILRVKAKIRFNYNYHPPPLFFINYLHRGPA